MLQRNNLKKITFISNTHKLVGNLARPSSKKKKVGVLILHGGGKSSKERFQELQERLLSEGYASLAFDFQGVGESEGKFESGTLTRTLQNANSALKELQRYTDVVCVIGCSMGGHIAARLTENNTIQNLILLYPAAYGKKAENKKLNTSFTHVIRQPNSWKNSHAFSSLKKFKESVNILYGQYDKVIPTDIQNAYKKITEKKGTFTIISGASHLLLLLKNDEELHAKQVTMEAIIKLLNENLHSVKANS